jgi:hypothetical protein
LPRNHRLADVHRWSDIDDVIAVNMPNEPSIEATWETYKTTVDEIERISGYDLLALLPDNIEESVETRDYSEARSLDAARGLILDLASVANLPRGNATSLQAKIDAAQQQLGIAEPVPAANQLRAALNELEALTDSHRITPDQGATLRALINAVLSSISS